MTNNFKTLSPLSSDNQPNLIDCFPFEQQVSGGGDNLQHIQVSSAINFCSLSQAEGENKLDRLPGKDPGVVFTTLYFLRNLREGPMS